MRVTIDKYFFEAGGREFESDVADLVSSFAKAKWGIGAVKFSTIQQDRYEGTDLYVLGIPIDFTLAFEKKDRTRKLGVMSLDGMTIEFGIRFGNGKATFKTPVLVIGADSTIGITLNNMWLALYNIKSNLQEILNVGMDKYLVVTEK